MIPADKKRADANPTKAFFVRMITRDITLEDCIFDLVDNSIDGAWGRVSEVVEIGRRRNLRVN